ncbi:uncharacterized protein LOC143376834 [Andrena cerasifolii]|uniref:uncharacterized protein LOC143376834 n=1 Tax=Andrena cerasifolii TaxID=2819439 RepID=UPI0040377871
MESLSQPPAKKTRYLKHIEFPVTECRREFKLPQQFPSMAPAPRPTVANGKSPANPTNPTCVLRNVSDKASNEASVMSAVKKLRIRSQDGKDLGEINVRILSEDDVLDPITGVLSKSSFITKINKLVKFSILPPEGADASSTLRQDRKGSSPSPKKVPSGSSIEKLLQRPLTSSRPSTVPDQDRIAQNRKLMRKETILCMSDHALKCGKASNTLTQVDAAKNRNLLMSKTDDSEKLKSRENAREIVNKVSTLNIESEHWQLVKSKFPVVKCEKLMIPRNNINVKDLFKLSRNVNSSHGNSADAQSKAIEEKKVKSSKTSSSARLNETIERIQAALMNSAVAKEPSTIIQDNQNKVNPPNCIATGDGNTTATTNSSNTLRREYTLCPAPRKNIHTEPVSSSNEGTGSSRNAQKKDSSIQNTISSTNNVEDTAAISSEKEKLSQHWDIIKEALISVKDEDLRSKALQALADCGIGIAKQVPIIPPEEQRTVHDSQVQTDVFGLLDLESFVLVKKDAPALERIKQTVRSSSSTPVNAERSAQPGVKRSNYLDNIDLFPMLSPMTYMEDDIGIDCLNELFSASTEASKVNQILSTPHSLYKKVAFQLQKDVEGIQQPDEKGLLNIHRAVEQNNLNEVQRLLLVLNASKISIDVLTEDRMSCLELAVKSKASRELVHVLLQAGAKPVSTELLHDSAVLLASKLSSPLLPDLLIHVTDSKLLNQVDSAGLAPLHYCVLHGNLEGASALVEAGADVNLRDNRSGRTAFFHALEHNRITIAQKLLEYGAIANLPNFTGQSVLCLVDDSKSLALKSALKQIVS